jgi:Pyruvate/2-oxoacid:ferredoxin oxidoreductase gamma subunit
MENKNQPIHPVMMQKIGNNDYRAHQLGDPKQYTIPMAGLTKRELIAAMAMQGYLASFAGSHSDPSAESVAVHSVGYADALLKELEKQ